MALPDAHTEEVWITINKFGSSQNYNFRAMVGDVDIDEGDRPQDSIPVMSGGRIPHFRPQEDSMVTLECYPINNSIVSAENTDEATGVSQLFFENDGNGSYAWDTSEPYVASTSRTRTKFRVTILWTNDPNWKSQAATEQPAVGYGSYRWYSKDCYCVSCKKPFGDKILKHVIKFQCPPFNRAGTQLIFDEGTNTSAQLSALGTYS